VAIRSRPRRAANVGDDAACWNAAACLSADRATVAIMVEAKGVILSKLREVGGGGRRVLLCEK
jgi:hypothetical protein